MKRILFFFFITIVIVTGLCSCENNQKELQGIQVIKRNSKVLPYEEVSSDTTNQPLTIEPIENNPSDVLAFPPAVILYVLHKTEKYNPDDKYSMADYIQMLNLALPKKVESFGKTATVEKVTKVSNTLYLKVLVDNNVFKELNDLKQLYLMQLSMLDYLQSGIKHQEIKEALKFLNDSGVDICVHLVSSTSGENEDILIRHKSIENILLGKYKIMIL